jgi:hypothetical protein
LEVKFITPQYSTVLSGEEYYIEYEIVAKDSAGDPIMEEGLATWKINGKTYTQTCTNGIENKFRVDEYLDHNIDKNKIILVVSMPTGGSKNSIVSKTWYVTAVNLRLDWPWTYSEEEYRKDDRFALTFTPYGNVDCTAHIVFDNSFEEGVTYFKEEIPASKTGRSYTTNLMPSLSYGPHTCQIYLEATINGELQETKPIENIVTFTKGSDSTILTVPFKNATVSQYDTVNIPFLVYDPDTEVCKVSLLVNDVPITEEG